MLPGTLNILSGINIPRFWHGDNRNPEQKKPTWSPSSRLGFLASWNVTKWANIVFSLLCWLIWASVFYDASPCSQNITFFQKRLRVPLLRFRCPPFHFKSSERDFPAAPTKCKKPMQVAPLTRGVTTCTGLVDQVYCSQHNVETHHNV